MPSENQTECIAPTVRLAYFSIPAVNNALMNLRLSHQPGSQCDNVLEGARGVQKLPDDMKPALLVSFVYLQPFLEKQSKYQYRDWVLDSGAFSAHNSGKEIKLQDYIDCCKRLMDSDQTLTEVYSLDVIGDWKASLKNPPYLATILTSRGMCLKAWQKIIRRLLLAELRYIAAA